jgi:pyridinium-3,5-bisthiocarboxylic acid mononucleotide nickel chelatase
LTRNVSVPYDEKYLIAMRIAYLECFSGISGDIFLGALVDAGVSPQLLRDTVAGLGVDARLEFSRALRSGISATKADVWVNGAKVTPREEYPQSRKLDHQHPHVDHGRQNHAQTERGHSHGRSRGLIEIERLILGAPISETAKETAIAIFRVLGAAEAKIHGTSVENVHFHEIGAEDAIVDIVCAAVGSEALGVDAIVCSALNVGGGTILCAHGTFPVPAPATVEILKNVPVYSSGVQAELVTPTGAAIVRTLATRFTSFPEMKIEQSGYGAGSRDFPGLPNVARLTIGEASGEAVAGTESDRIVVLEANLDDLNPQVFGYVMDRLFAEGSLDAFAVPVQMKKNRPGILLTVLCKPENAHKLTQLIFAETTTLGVRHRQEDRYTLARRWENVRTQWGEIRIKIASMNGNVTNYAHEYEDCRRVAAEYHVPLKTVMQEADRVYLETRKTA